EAINNTALAVVGQGMGMERRAVAAVELFVGAGDEAAGRIGFAGHEVGADAALPVVRRLPGGDGDAAGGPAAPRPAPTATLLADVALAIGEDQEERRMGRAFDGVHRGGGVGTRHRVEPGADRAASAGLSADPVHGEIFPGATFRGRRRQRALFVFVYVE